MGGRGTVPRPGQAERRARHTEALLLLVVLCVLAVGGVLVAGAKDRQVGAGPPPDRQVRINRAGAADLARALQAPVAVAERVVAERERAGPFPDVDSLRERPTLFSAPERERLRRAGLSPRSASRRQIESVIGRPLDAATQARLQGVRGGTGDEALTWERIAAHPLISPARVRAAESRLVVRTWNEARNQFAMWCGVLAAFVVAAHLVVRRLRPRSDPFLLPIAALLCVLGVLVLFSIKDPLRDAPAYAAQVQGIVVGGGLALLLALSGWLGRLPLHRYGYLYAVAAVAGTLLLGLLGSGPGGVRLSVFGTQPVEAIKILLVFFLAAYLAERGPLLNDPLRRMGPFPIPRRRDAAPLLVLYALPLGLFALVKDLGPVLLLFGAFLILVYLATGRGIYVLLGIGVLLAGAWLGYALRFGVFQTRVDMWLSPWTNGHRGGDQLARGLWGLASGGAWGSGLGLGAPHFIPRGGSDLVFASLGEELGLAGTLAVTVCCLLVLARGFRSARRCGSDFDRLLAAGLAGLFGLQALIIISGTLGLLPLAGITLPFVSFGKSSLVASFFLLGMLLTLSHKASSPTDGGGRNVFAPPAYDAAAARVTLFFLVVLGGVVGGRLLWLQWLAADRLAAREVRVPDADGVSRPHVNPRLLSLTRRIRRGRLLDRTGVVLAETRDGRRIYPLGAAAGHLTGYLDPAVGGPVGLEARFDAELRGFSTWASLVPVWRAKDLPAGLAVRPSARLPEGSDVVLALDAALQKAALAALERGAAGVRDRRTGRPKNRGAVVVLDVGTGGVLAAATLPGYDPGALTPARLQALRTNLGGDFPLINRAFDGRYPPGSTFKIVTASALFAAGRADLTRSCGHVDTNVIWSEGGATYARRRIVDDEGERPHGLVNLTEAVSQSCNIYFAHAGITLGADVLRAQAERFGFSRLPAPAQFRSELPDVSYGQGPLLVSPLEMAVVALAVANDGKRLLPRFAKKDTAAPPAVSATPLSPEAAARLAEMMRRVTVSGTAAGRFDGLGYGVAGKTGTAENEENDKMSHSWFIGFAPAERPRIAFAVIVENAGYGARVAVPVAREVLRAASF